MRRTILIRTAVVVVLLAGLGIGGKNFWRYLDSYESTDDAQIDGRLNPVSARISGTVIAVHFDDNENVCKDQELIELDPRDYQVALTQANANVLVAASQLTAEMPNVAITETANQSTVATAKAEIARIEASIAEAERDYDSAVAALKEAEANSTRAQADEGRYRGLAQKQEVSLSLYDQKLADARATDAAVQVKKANLEAARRVISEREASLIEARTHLAETEQNSPRNLWVKGAVVQVRQADLAVAKARAEQAALNLGYTKIAAPVKGIAGKKNVEAGQHVDAGQPLLMITQTDDLWVTANFKETQLQRMHAGQKVTISVDAFGRQFEGTIESLPGATGARYSVLPPENATGNYVKVVQRLPVRIRFNRNQAGLDQLRLGMSVIPTVWVK
jgi:membrane fusion protein (multidrug efflux system)